MKINTLKLIYFTKKAHDKVTDSNYYALNYSFYAKPKKYLKYNSTNHDVFKTVYVASFCSIF